MSIPIITGTYMLQVIDPDNRWLNAVIFHNEPTLCVNDGAKGTKWTISLLSDLKHYKIQADDGSYLCPAPVPSAINLHHRTDIIYFWTLDAISGTTYKVVDPVSTLALAIATTNGIQLDTAQTKGLIFKFVPVEA